ncbi:hypothetical protein [Campylobacter showae]|uniref:hypothetical protein n=1 Tax=Campylobacter showae TaxID=204 RepID=UPI000F09394B|nr:hypothetical protein [Campylobacter showae]
MRPIYIATLGDAWLSKDSLDVIGYYSTEKKAYKALKAEIEKQGYELDNRNEPCMGYQIQGAYGIYHKYKNGDYIDFETFGCYDVETVNINERY